MSPVHPANSDLTRNSGIASGKHQGLRHPADDERVEDALENTGLDDRGERMEDHLRDRHSKGARSDDDAIDRADGQDRQDARRHPGAQSSAKPPHRQH
jgi:hypothetical protein